MPTDKEVFYEQEIPKVTNTDVFPVEEILITNHMTAGLMPIMFSEESGN